MSRHSGAQASINALPDAVLGFVFAVAGREQGQAATLVCKRWRRVFFSEPLLWRSLWLSPQHTVDGDQEQWLASKRRLLQRVGGLALRIKVDDRWGWGLAAPDWLALLEPGLRMLDVHAQGVAMQPAAVQSWVRFQQLTALRVKCQAVPPCTPRVLGQLWQLQQLTVDTREGFPAGLLESVAALVQLSYLELSSTLAPLPPAECLTSLRLLNHLYLDGRNGPASPLSPPLPATFPQLQQYMFLGRHVKVAGAVIKTTLLCLQQADEGLQTAGSLVLDIRDVAALGPLLQALVPPSIHLTALVLRGFLGLPAASVGGCSQLAQLTELKLAHCWSDRLDPGDDAADAERIAALDAMLVQAPQLARLTFDWCRLRRLPPAVVGMRGLRALSCSVNWLETLPPGPYLEGLKSLNLNSNHFSEVPQLAAASSLKYLSLSDNRRLRVLRQQVDNILLPLPALRKIDLDGTETDEGVLDYLRAGAPQLRVLPPPQQQQQQP